MPQLISVTALSQLMLPVAEAGGKLLLATIILGIVAATSGAALETTLSAGYTIAQFLGWPWGKVRPPAQAARFHLLMIICLTVGVGTLLTGVYPIQVTEISMVFSAWALPLTRHPAAAHHRTTEWSRARYLNLRRSLSQSVPWISIIDVGVVIKLAITGETTDLTWTERWVRDRIIGSIPGGRTMLGKISEHSPEGGSG